MSTAEEARLLDEGDPLAHFRDRFHVQPNLVYLDGNSLGMLSTDAEDEIHLAIAQWKQEGVAGWDNWFTAGEDLGARMAPLVGASADNVVATGSTTVNLHQLIASFYKPKGKRTRIVATALDFPSDIYALQSQIRLHGGDPDADLVRVESRDGRVIEEDDLIAALGEDVALLLIPSVLYRSGQLLDMELLAHAAHQHGVLIGVDACHSVGAVPHQFEAWGVDFAIWCTYKYLNAGPGAVGALFVHPRHAETDPALAGWWGYQKQRQFDMVHTWEGAPGAGRFQISTIPVLSAAALSGALRIHEEAGITAIRAKSLALTDYLIHLLRSHGLLDAPYNFHIGTPLDHTRRGGHLALEHEEAASISVALRKHGIVADFRQPNIVRLAPVALHVSYRDCWKAVMSLKAIMDIQEWKSADLSAPVT